MKIFYMNQGGGEWPPVKYADFDIILLAESNQPLPPAAGFKEVAKNQHATPPMAIHTKADRVIESVQDLDVTAQTVRPITMFNIVGTDISVVFFHLKSGNASIANDALQLAVDKVAAKLQFGPPRNIVWIGDRNRADDSYLVSKFGKYAGHVDGGVAKWYLDCAYATGKWAGHTVAMSTITKSSDNNHAGILVTIEKS